MSSIASPSRRRALQSLAAGAASLALPAFAQWPDKPVRIVVTFPAGGSSDILARVMAEQLGKKLGQAFVVDNRPGAGGTIGGAQVAAAPADGYTLMLSNTTPIALGPFALEKQPYDPVLAFTHIAYLGSAPLVIMASKSAGIASYAQLDARARKEGLLNFGSGGPGSVGHIHGELIRKTTGIPMVHVPYRGGAPMTTDLIANVIPVAIDVVTAYVPFFRSGQLVPLAVTGNARSPLIPETPTVAELGQPQLVLENFFGLSAPAGLPPDIVARLNAACNEILVMPQVSSKLLELGIVGKPGPVDRFEELVKAQVGILGSTVRGASIRL
ncbi:tripartite-type tricarboxylate transporter receptor subunit TctC [Variovorax boronicumulans]|uniref:Tripartite-type tricarboxylate transporter receptor subunit TctC n=1 Tax=Variovorax boronicumulans TaxID=436515 RepID=A0AAW8D3N2_9BURK|nr:MULTISPECIES: tripartite tricarboxylate transporter substrate-binding protein [Variovorax]MDP9894476.1 tripartite-type tricarboxylate transporter receptor subunit TctC [Variovorax boronicumulans]MDQ0054295.1 tripartite-type tricarboxylate transporter receptor subunit TctC [Variovorax boronicumulans]MDQ0609243.1 tripartite-type tricarboxylate transporter receptor subunit TctC [Variovorax sp. W1I1]